MKKKPMTAAQSLRAKGYDVESYGNKCQAQKGLYKSEWFGSLESLLDAVIEFEKSWTFGARP